MRHYSIIDRLIMNIDQGVRTLFSSANAERQTPGQEQASPELAEDQRREVAGLMRINHAGEVSAQALYQGQALTARLPEVRDKMEQAANEEVDHLAWCEQRLQELASHTSYLNPIWYTGSFLIGALAGLVGDRWSLGFVAETERQVVKHLENHLQRLPTADNKSRAILQQMQQDEQHHATIALEAGASELPEPVKELMKLMSKVMTTTAYYC